MDEFKKTYLVDFSIKMTHYDYFRGHQIFNDGRFFIARHGNKVLKSTTRHGIELLIASVSKQATNLELAEYHLARVLDLVTSELGTNPAGDEENALLIQLKRTHALLIQTQWKRSK